ncbi:MAG: DivIVA domain-containing protein [Acidimicrobiia bacterium]|nr:DivIVA domain-containing protein [Acidimicrobiia bacterium]
MAQQSDKLRLLRRIPDIRFEEESRGYSKDQVDRVLANLAPLADEIEKLHARLAEAETRAASAEARLIEARSPSQPAVPPGPAPGPMPDFDETLRNTLVNAQRTADTLVREAKEEAERLRNEAEFQSNALLADARDQANEMTTEAVAHRERLLGEAAAERAKMLDSAREEAQHRVSAVVDELSQAHENERARLLDQIADLQHIHGLLQGDVTRFERHLEARRADVKRALEELNAVLDDAEALRSREALEPAEIGVVDSTDYPPIAVEVVALHELEAEAAAAIEATTRPTEVIAPEELDDLAPPPTPSVNGEEEVDEEPVYEATAPVVAREVVYADSYAEEITDSAATPPPPNGASQVPPVPVGAGGPPASPPTGDPFLDELRRVTTEEPAAGDPITNFLEEDNSNRGGGGWFGRRK